MLSQKPTGFFSLTQFIHFSHSLVPRNLSTCIMSALKWHNLCPSSCQQIVQPLSLHSSGCFHQWFILYSLAIHLSQQPHFSYVRSLFFKLKCMVNLMDVFKISSSNKKEHALWEWMNSPLVQYIWGDNGSRISSSS